MANLIEVTDAADERLADYVRLRETTLRRQLENEGGLFIAEGAKIIRRAVNAGYQPRSFLLAERWLPGLADLLDATEAPVYVVSEEVAELVLFLTGPASASMSGTSYPIDGAWTAY